MEYKEQLKSVQDNNLNMVLFELRKLISATPILLADKTKISIPTIHKYLNYMVSKNIAIETLTKTDKVGRHSFEYSLNRNFSHYLLISIGYNKIITKTVDFMLRDIDTKEYKINSASFTSNIALIIEENLLVHPLIKGIFISIKARVQDGTIENFKHYEHLNGTNLKTFIESNFNTNCIIKSDIEILTINCFKLLTQNDNHALVAKINDDEMAIASIINKQIHFGLDYLNKDIAPTTFKLPNNKAYELILKVGISLIGPDIIMLFSNKHKKDITLKIVDTLNEFYPKAICPKIIYNDNYLSEIFYGLKMITNHSTKIKYVGAL